MSQPASSPVPLTMAESGGEPDSYIVSLKDTANQADHINWVKGLEETYWSDADYCRITYEYRIIKGYSIILKGAALNQVRARDDVESIVQNNRVSKRAGPAAKKKKPT